MHSPRMASSSARGPANPAAGTPIPASWGRAVDLSGLKRTTPNGGSATTSAAGAGPIGSDSGRDSYITDVTEATFQADVLQRSLQMPVVIDFWAEWCQPCKQLGPLLEKLAEQAKGAWVLARVDVDAQQRLAAAFQVQSIPMVVAVVGGRPVDAFRGAIPEQQLRQWLTAVLETANSMGITGPQTSQASEPTIDPRLEAARDHLKAGKFDEAEAGFRQLLAEQPNDRLATTGVAEVGLRRRLADAPNPGQILIEAKVHSEDLARVSLAADVQFDAGDPEAAFNTLIEFIRRARGDQREAARAHLLELFAILPPDAAVVRDARRDLASALF